MIQHNCRNYTVFETIPDVNNWRITAKILFLYQQLYRLESNGFIWYVIRLSFYLFFNVLYHGVYTVFNPIEAANKKINLKKTNKTKEQQ